MYFGNVFGKWGKGRATTFQLGTNLSALYIFIYGKISILSLWMYCHLDSTCLDSRIRDLLTRHRHSSARKKERNQKHKTTQLNVIARPIWKLKATWMCERSDLNYSVLKWMELWIKQSDTLFKDSIPFVL